MKFDSSASLTYLFLSIFTCLFSGTHVDFIVSDAPI